MFYTSSEKKVFLAGYNRDVARTTVLGEKLSRNWVNGLPNRNCIPRAEVSVVEHVTTNFKDSGQSYIHIEPVAPPQQPVISQLFIFRRQSVLLDGDFRFELAGTGCNSCRKYLSI